MKRIFAVASGIALLITGINLAPANAVPDYPTAAEVAAAKRNVAEKKKMVDRIEGILNTLESEARALEKVALEKSCWPGPFTSNPIVPAQTLYLLIALPSPKIY